LRYLHELFKLGACRTGRQYFARFH
jgi:hypothetical protein